jgi:hypothetical protein
MLTKIVSLIKHMHLSLTTDLILAVVVSMALLIVLVT